MSERATPREYPEPNDPTIKPGSALDRMAQSARADFAAITPEEIDAAMGEENAQASKLGKDGGPQKKMTDEAVASVMRAVNRTQRGAEFRKVFGNQPLELIRGKMEHRAAQFMERHGVDIDSKEVPKQGDPAEAAESRTYYAEEKLEYEGVKRENAEVELGKNDPAALGAILETRRGLGELYTKLRKDFGYQHSEHDDIRKEELDWVKDASPEAASLVRKLRVAEEQLERLEKEKGLRE